MNTQKEKQNLKRHKKNMRRPALLEAQNVLSKEINEWSKMLDPIDVDDFPFKVRSPVRVEPSEKEIA